MKVNFNFSLDLTENETKLICDNEYRNRRNNSNGNDRRNNNCNNRGRNDYNNNANGRNNCNNIAKDITNYCGNNSNDSANDCRNNCNIYKMNDDALNALAAMIGETIKNQCQYNNPNRK